MTDPRFNDLIELSRRMTSSLDLRTVSDDVLTSAIRATGAAKAAIALWDRELDVLVTLTDIEVVELGSTTPSGEIFLRLEEYPATRRVLAERCALSIDVDPAGDDSAERRWLREYGLSAVLVLPLISRGEAIGIMEIARGSGAFSADDVSYCQLLCDMAGSAVENAKLYGELQATLTQYRSLIERLPAITYLDDLETGESQFVSPQSTELFGITPEEWMASPDAWLEPGSSRRSRSRRERRTPRRRRRRAVSRRVSRPLA